MQWITFKPLVNLFCVFKGAQPSEEKKKGQRRVTTSQNAETPLGAQAES